jgi:glucosamine-6-phosphate deaminase
LSSRTRIKTLAYDTIKANSRFFGGDESAVPKMALTVGVGTVVDAREVVVIITGAHKANALAKCIEEGVSHMWTVSALQLHQRACIVCDDDATLELRVKTVRYFKGLQETMEKLSRGGGYEGNPAISNGGLRAAQSPIVQLPHGVPGAIHIGPGGVTE